MGAITTTPTSTTTVNSNVISSGWDLKMKRRRARHRASTKRWLPLIRRFESEGRLMDLIPYLPVNHPRLPVDVYDTALTALLMESKTHAEALRVAQKWAAKAYLYERHLARLQIRRQRRERVMEILRRNPAAMASLNAYLA
eukprot:CAMPEP_0175072926 /NCGR_PEP_ID=MMETSP0052_2-20121109/20220_1 /TAXON_ID=51329 ORGANISM="Polytomella parva, Strain SAG 63-3" /NCGR_SAMPLE_ID=MMETSP0052_2 /ASSEMBLY_ACC=CAM_ASM_000194 /LENGTH=140 /DNA_ID=CAMNT_0016340563 /DNA_START=51 /DNA_END=469 /DNA_ORIENTATION=+